MLKQKIKELETLIAKLESPDTDLDRAFQLHEDGVKLIRNLEQAFEQANETIERNTGGEG